jgi:glutamate-1-semialdehyde 2,1-aminomutase
VSSEATSGFGAVAAGLGRSTVKRNDDRSAVASSDEVEAAHRAERDVLLNGVIDDQERIFLERQTRSAELIERAHRSLAGGVTSSWQITRPQAVWISHGSGSKIYDVDGTEYIDLHGGYGAGLAGHAHPAIVNAVRTQVTNGTHFAQPTEAAIAVAEALVSRFGLPLWRFMNSGTEATMDAIHLMRAATGRDYIIKVEGCYHGHHDSVQVSVQPDLESAGPKGRPFSVAASAGIPDAVRDITLVATFNDLDSVASILRDYGDRVAGMIIEPIMMNAGIIMPVDGYLAGLIDLLHAYGALLCFDEVKTGLTVGPGGATSLLGVAPDIVCLAKSVGGGLICGAVGGTDEVMGYVVDGTYEMVGTFNGNPLSMAAAQAMLMEVATPDAYQRIDRHRALVDDALANIIDRRGLPAHVVSVGAKGCATFATQPVRNYRDFLEVDDRYNVIHWLYQHNGGVFLPPWGKTEQWLISVQHEEADLERFIDNFERFASAVTA